MNNNNKDIAIIGLGFKLPGNSNNPESLWNNLLEGFDAITQVPKERWGSSYKEMDLISNKYGGFLQDSEWKSFDPLFFGISAKEAPFIDPQQRLLLSIVWEALEDAHIPPKSLRGTNTGVFIGVSNIDYSKMIFQDNYKISPYTITGTNTSLNSNRISYCYDFRGPSLTIDTACSSSLISVGLGCQSIQNGESDLAVCGGVNALFDPTTSIAFSKLGVLSESGHCNAFSSDANGYVRSEGAGVVILKSLEKAELDGDRIYGVIKGISINEDGQLNKNSLTTPSSESQSNNIENAMKKSNLSPNDIYYVEAHGTGTKVGDPIEVKSISNIFSNDRNNATIEDDDNNDNEIGSTKQTEPLYIGSFKSNIGHLESAAGIASLIKVCLMLKNRILVPSINCSTLNPEIPFDEYKIQVVREIQMFPNDKLVNIGINSFGFGGSNCHAIVQEYNNTRNKLKSSNELLKLTNSTLSTSKNYLIPISMNSKNSLDKYLNLIKTNPNYHEEISFKDFVKYSILSKQYTLSNKMTIVANDWNSFIKSSNEFYSSTTTNSTQSIVQTTTSSSTTTNLNQINVEPVLAFVFCGQGPQWNGMMKQIYENEIVFKSTVDYVDNILSGYFGYSIFKQLQSIQDNDDLINQPIVAQPSLFLLQIGLVELFKYWGIFPSISIGHSFGEVSSYYLSGLISLETACKIVYVRAYYQNKTIGTGKMLVCSISNEKWLEEFSQQFADLEIACINSSDSIVVTGNETRLKEFSQLLNENQIFNTFLRSPCSFHSSKQESIKQSILDELKDIQSKDKCEIPLFSTVTGELVNEKVTSETIYNNVREPVLFKKAIKNLIEFYQSHESSKTRKLIFVEIAPHPTLGSLIKKSAEESSMKSPSIILSPLNRKENQDLSLKKLISQLYFNNLEINFKFQLNDDIENGDNQFKETTFNLPRYQWDTEEYFFEPLESKKNRLQGPPTTLLGHQINYSLPVYQTVLDLKNKNFKYLLDHMVSGKSVFPGAGYIDIICQFFSKSSSTSLLNETINIDSIQFLQPFYLNENKLQFIQSAFEPILNKKLSFNVNFFIKDQDQDQWLNSCKSQISLDQSSSSSINKEMVNLEELKLKSNLLKLSKNELYDKISSKLGLKYNEAFQIIQEIHTGKDCSFAELQIPSSNHSNTILNNCLLDNCFHGLLTLINDKGSYVIESVLQLSIHLENISIDENFKNQKFYLSTELIKQSSLLIEGKCKLFNKDGKLLLSIGKFIIKSINPKLKMNQQLLDTPIDETLSIEWQSKDSPIAKVQNSIQLNQSLLFLKSTILKDSQFDLYCSSLIFTQLSKSIKEFYGLEFKELVKEIFKNNQFDESNYSNEEFNNGIFNLMNKLSISNEYFRYFKRILSILKNIDEIKTSTQEIEELKKSLEIKYYSNIDSSINYEFQLIEKVSNILPELLLKNDKSVSMKLFENNLLTKFYGESISTTFYLEYVSQLILESIKPILKEKRVFRILEIGAGSASLSNVVLNKLNQFLLLNQESKQIVVEYNFTDISSGFLNIQNELIKKYPMVQFKFSILNLDKDLKDQSFYYGDYDLVLMAYVIHACENIEFAVKKIYELLSPRGQLICIEPKSNIVFSDLVFGTFSQWWAFSDSIRTNHCSLESEQWEKILNENGFSQSSFIGSSEMNSHSFIIHSQKESILQMKNLNEKSLNSVSFILNSNQLLSITNTTTTPINDSSNNGNNNDNCSKLLNAFINESTLLSTNPINILNLKELNLNLQKLLESNLIFFMVGLNIVEQFNYKDELFEFIQLLNLLNSNNFKGKLIVMTKQSNTRNIFSRSLIGITTTSFNEYPNLDSVSIDIDSYDYSFSTILKPIVYKFSDKEFILKKGLFFVSRIFNNQSKLLLSSKSFETNKENLYLTTQLDLSLKYEIKSNQLLDDQVEIQVVSVGLNFKDNLFSRSLLPNDIIRKGNVLSPPYGLEVSGTISRIGSNVTEFKVGDSVFGFARHSLASHAITSKDLVILKPNSISFEEAASLPIVYSTAYYSLFNVANLKSNESVLIHSATGGVGLASLNLLKMKGFKNAYCTVGSNEKKDYLQQNYSDTIKSIYSTRSKDYSNHLENSIDVVLNTLDGNYVESNFNCLKSYGRLVDLSVTHVYNNQQIGLSNFKYDRIYNCVDLETMIDEKKSELKEILMIISNQIDQGNLQKIPIKQFEFNESSIKTAINSLSERTHIGKLVVSNQVQNSSSSLSLLNNNDSIVRISKLNYNLNLNSTLLITGQSGLSIPILEWILLHSNISNVVICSKSEPKWKIQKVIKQFEEKIKFNYLKIDIANYDELFNSIKSLPNDLPPIKAIIHLAAIYNDGPMNKVTPNIIESVHGPKVSGAINLHRISIALGLQLSHFILFSSITGITGIQDQAVYNSANVILDSLSNQRKLMGLPSFSVNLGAMKSEGKVAETKAIKELFKVRGLPTLSLNKLFALLEVVINNPSNLNIPTQLICTPINFTNYLDSFKNMHIKLSHLSLNQELKEKEKATVNNNESILELTLEKVSELLSINKSKINLDVPLKNYGLDSLTTTLFKSFVDKQFGKGLLNHSEIPFLTINSFIEKVEKVENKQTASNTTIVEFKVLDESNQNQLTEIKKVTYNSNLILNYIPSSSPIKKPILNLLASSDKPLLKSSLSLSQSTITQSIIQSITTPPSIKHIKNLNNNLLDTPPLTPVSRKSKPTLIQQQYQPLQLSQPQKQVSYQTNNNSFILSIGSSTPGEPISQESLKESISNDYSEDKELNDKQRRIFDQTHIKSRHLVRDYTKPENSIKYREKETITDSNKVFVTESLKLSKAAALKAIENWGGELENITHIMSVSSTGASLADANVKLIQELGLNQDVERVSLNMMGCLAGLSSLRVASSIAKASKKNRILVICVEICSISFNANRTEGDQMVANSIFADGAAAYVVGCSPRIDEDPLYEVIQSTTVTIKDTIDEMTWDIKAEGFQLGLSSSIPTIISNNIEPFVNDLLDKSKSQVGKLSVKDCEMLIHTGGKAILHNIEQALDISPNQMTNTWDIYSNYGNMSSASVIFVMDRASKSNNLPQYSISLAFGPGVACEGALLKNLK